MEIQPYKYMWFTVDDNELKLYYPDIVEITGNLTDNGELIINL